MKRSATFAAIALAGVSMAVIGVGMKPTPAKAVALAGCPSFVMPPPCIIFDYKRLAENAQEYAHEYEKLKETVTSIQKAKENAESIGESLSAGFDLKDTESTGARTNFATEVTGSNYSQLSSNFAQKMFGGSGVNQDAMTSLRSARASEDVAATTDSLATSFVAKQRITEDAERMAYLQKLAGESRNLREDWSINGQIRLEIGRQVTQKNQLLATLLRGEAVNGAVSAQADQVASTKGGSILPTPNLGGRSAGWDLLSQLKAKEAEIRSTMTLLAFAQQATGVEEDISAIIKRHENAEATKASTFAAFQRGAYNWSRSKGSYIISTTLSELSRIDSQMAALRARPIEQLSGAFRARNLDVQELTAAGIDPRQFLGTWSDPLKGETTLDMANALLKGRLDGPIDGDENDEYRVAVMNYNNARLEEAWLETHKIEAQALLTQTRDMVGDETKSAGYEVSAANVEAKLRTLVGEANSLAQQIQSSGEPAATGQASQIMSSISTLLNGG